jgi:hypothetical protein
MPLIKEFLGREVKCWERIAAYPALILACFQEYLCAVMILAVLASIAYRVFAHKKFPGAQLDYLAICIVMLVVALTALGNANRLTVETATYFPEYQILSFFKKLDISFASMMQAILFENGIFVCLFCCFL